MKNIYIIHLKVFFPFLPMIDTFKLERILWRHFHATAFALFVPYTVAGLLTPRYLCIFYIFCTPLTGWQIAAALKQREDGGDYGFEISFRIFSQWDLQGDRHWHTGLCWSDAVWLSRHNTQDRAGKWRSEAEAAVSSEHGDCTERYDRIQQVVKECQVLSSVGDYEVAQKSAAFVSC